MPRIDIAFSSTYNAVRPKGVQIADANFNIISVDAGKQHNFEAEIGSRLKICSIASGRVDVALGKLDFGIGEGGMWRVKSGECCVVRNEGYETAVLHITSMQ